MCLPSPLHPLTLLPHTLSSYLSCTFATQSVFWDGFLIIFSREYWYGAMYYSAAILNILSVSQRAGCSASCCDVSARLFPDDGTCMLSSRSQDRYLSV